MLQRFEFAQAKGLCGIFYKISMEVVKSENCQ